MKLGHGGFSQHWREKVLEVAVRGYEKMWGKELEGSGRINRPERSTRTVRRWKNLVEKSRWFQPSGREDVERKGEGKRKEKRRKKRESMLK